MEMNAERANDFAAKIYASQQAAVTEVGGKQYMTDAKGNLVPLALVKPMDRLMDEEVRKLIVFARDLSEQMARFKAHCFDDVGSLQALLDQEYDVKIGGAKGNITLGSYDGTLRVTVQVADQITFGAELQAAKALIDECLMEWSDGSRDELRAVVNRTFNVDKEGQINRAGLFMLMRVDISDPRWQNAMKAIRDSMRVVGSKTYIRFHEREAADGKWHPISIDLATV